MEYLLTDEIVFDAKPDAVPYNYRISYKVAQMCLIIYKCCKRGGCKLLKIHVISNALNTKAYMKSLDDYVNEKSNLTIIRFDPAVNRAIKYAFAEGLIEQQKNGKFILTENGKVLSKQIEDEGLLKVETEYLIKLGSKLTDKKIDSLMTHWRYNNAEDK